jgi:hypothetical protein
LFSIELPVNIDQTAKSKSNAQDKGGTNEDSSRHKWRLRVSYSLPVRAHKDRRVRPARPAKKEQKVI